MTAYLNELCKAMGMLSDNGYVFCGQAMLAGTAMSATLDAVPILQKLEFPVMENTQLGFCTGVSLTGGKICSIFPRINFMLEALPQLIQHLDKIPLFSDFKPKVIIRTAIATSTPLDPGPQHLGQYADAINLMLSTINVVKLYEAEDIMPAYEEALKSEVSTILVEFSEKLI